MVLVAVYCRERRNVFGLIESLNPGAQPLRRSGGHVRSTTVDNSRYRGVPTPIGQVAKEK